MIWGISLRTTAAATLLAASLFAQTPDQDAAKEAFQAQDWPRAAAAYEALARAKPQDGAVQLRLGMALFSLGRADEAVRALEAAERHGAPAPTAAWQLARACARLGRRDDAIAALKRAAAGGFFSMPQLESDADVKRLHDDPRFAEVRKAVDRNARPCVYAAEYRQLDFWVGEWDVASTTGPAGGPVAHSRIELIEDQCVVAESYVHPAGYSGRSFNSYHPDKRRWEQFWVDNKGAIHHYTGVFRDGNLYYEADGVRTQGPSSPPAKVKMTFFNQGPDQVRQLGEQSTDGGKTWSTSYDLTYRRRKPRG
jgi:tetratricopeptide (TPR) repeat protein